VKCLVEEVVLEDQRATDLGSHRPSHHSIVITWRRRMRAGVECMSGSSGEEVGLSAVACRRRGGIVEVDEHGEDAGLVCARHPRPVHMRAEVAS
jgi:hypothetical protein